MPGWQSPIPLTRDRALPLVARADLVIRPEGHREDGDWIVNDPISLRYFRLNAQQHCLLKLMDGSRSLKQLRAEFVKLQPSTRASEAEIQRLVFDLFNKNLLYSTRADQAAAQSDRIRCSRRKQLKQAAGNLLYIRFPGITPRPLMNALYPWVKNVFRPVGVAFGAALILASWLMLLIHGDAVVAMLPDPAEFASTEMLVLLWVTLGVTKLMHEFGHALACKHQGGECSEIGIALLVLSPCLYCDVSEAAMFRTTRAKLAVAAAGMYVELLLSALACFAWWYLQPGILRNWCLCIFLVTNASTIVFNLNPLLRLDGYFLLSDWLRIPNLRERANDEFNRWLAKVLVAVDLPTPDTRYADQRGWLMAYALLSGVYRWSFLLFVSLSLQAMLEPYGLGSVGLILGGVAAATSLVGSGRKLWRFVDAHRDQIETGRRLPATLLRTALVVATLLVVPLPWSLEVPVVVEGEDVQHVYVTTPGSLERVCVKPGEQVVAGQTLMLLRSTARRDRYRVVRTMALSQQVELNVQRALGNAAGEDSATKALQTLYEEGREYYHQLQELDVQSPCSGRVVEAPAVEAPDARRDTLSGWDGSVFDRTNTDALMRRGTHLLSVVPDGCYRGVLLIDQATRTMFRPGTTIRMKFDSLPSEVVYGKVASVALAPSEAAGGPTGNSRGASGSEPWAHPAKHYLATVEMESDAPPLLIGTTGRARVWVTDHSSVDWLWRQVRLTFNLNL